MFLEDRIKCRYAWRGKFAVLAAFDCAPHGEHMADPFNNRGARGAGIVVFLKLMGFIQRKASEQVSLGGFFRISRTGI